MLVRGIQVAGILLRIAVEDGNVAAGHKIGSRLYLGSLQRVGEPKLLRLAVRTACKEVGKEGVGVKLVLACVKTDEGDVAKAHRKVAAEVPIAGVAFRGIAEGEDVLKRAGLPSAQLVVALCKQERYAACIVGVGGDGRVQEHLLQFVHLLVVVQRVAVPHHTSGVDVREFLDGGLKALPTCVRVVHHRKVASCLLARRGEAVCLLVRFRAKDFHLVAALVFNAVRLDAEVVCGGGFESCKAYLHHLVIDACYAVAATLHRDAVAQVGFLAIGDKAVCQRRHAKGDVHAVLGIVHQRGWGVDEF